MLLRRYYFLVLLIAVGVVTLACLHRPAVLNHHFLALCFFHCRLAQRMLFPQSHFIFLGLAYGNLLPEKLPLHIFEWLCTQDAGTGTAASEDLILVGILAVGGGVRGVP